MNTCARVGCYAPPMRGSNLCRLCDDLRFAACAVAASAVFFFGLAIAMRAC